MAAEEPQQQPEPLGGDADGVNCLAYDEAIMAQQDRIQQEIAVQNPLVSERLELAVLYKEYAEDDHIYQQKIKDLLQKYSYIRKTRPDGNCFYRAFGFAHLEALLEDGQELQRCGTPPPERGPPPPQSGTPPGQGPPRAGDTRLCADDVCLCASDTCACVLVTRVCVCVSDTHVSVVMTCVCVPVTRVCVPVTCMCQ
uniref:ubiquitinyl hydrolase 1 n=1 Tax=Strigops habroptila TaxID=2489341 RepID=A0A672U2X5_STRHB